MPAPAAVGPAPRCRARLALSLAALPLLGCAAAAEDMMATPVLYHANALDPFAHLQPEDRSTSLEVFFATGRRPEPPGSGQHYSNEPAETVRLGVAEVRFGVDSWEQLHAASVGELREQPVYLEVGKVTEYGELPTAGEPDSATGTLLDELNARLGAVADPELLVYVHGVNVGFFHCTVRSAELTHFAGRDFVTLVFDWPCHTNILSYVLGDDEARARAAAADLTRLLQLLAEHSHARRIHLVCYSAGAKVGADGLLGLHHRAPEAEPHELAARYRLGTVLFAAGDLEEVEFLRDIDVIHDLAERVTVTVSDDDSALGMAEWTMGGGRRLGEEGAPQPAELTARHRLPRLEIVDVSIGQEERGFDIGGHHYWYRHPWVASDVILNLRLGLDAAERGLQSAAERVWYLPADYPDRAREVVQQRLAGRW